MKNSSFDENSLNNQYVRLEQSILSHVQNSKTPLELSHEVQMLKSHYYYSPLSIRIIENHKNEEVEWQNEPNSLTQIFALANSMVGTVVLLLPINYGGTGIILSTFIMVFIGTISFKTCTWIVNNTQQNEDDIVQVIKRNLGDKWTRIFGISSSLLFFMLTIIYYLLLSLTIWKILLSILGILNIKVNVDQDDKTIEEFSITYISIIITFVSIPLYYIKDIQIIVKIAGYGSGAIYCYIIFIFYIFFENLISGRIETAHKNGQINYWSLNPQGLVNIIGNFALAFQIHNAVTSLLSKRAKKSKNIRNLKYAFLLTMLIYGSIGTLGYLGLLGRQKQTKFPVIIYDYFEPSNWQSLIVEISFCANLISVFPLFPYMGKAQLFAIIFEKQNQNDVYPQWAYHAYNLVLLTISIILQIQQVKINLIIGLVGTWIGFLSVYIIPIHLQLKFKIEERISGNNQQNITKRIHIPHINYLQRQNYIHQSVQIKPSPINQNKSCQSQKNIYLNTNTSKFEPHRFLDAIKKCNSQKYIPNVDEDIELSSISSQESKKNFDLMDDYILEDNQNNFINYQQNKDKSNHQLKNEQLLERQQQMDGYPQYLILEIKKFPFLLGVLAIGIGFFIFQFWQIFN